MINGKRISLDAPKAELGDYQFWASAILTIFLDLSKQRGRSQAGAVPISFVDLEAYLRLNSIQLSPLEIDVVMDLDQVFISEVARQLSDELDKMKA